MRAFYKIYLMLFAMIGLAACQQASMAAPQSKPLVGKWRMLKIEEGDTVLQQCSRDTPAKGARYFIPDVSDVGAFEIELTAKLSEKRFFKQEMDAVSQYDPDPKRAEFTFANHWSREFIGIERGGRKYIYGNYSPIPPKFQTDQMEAQTKHSAEFEYNGPTIVCDGGFSFFGAEYDIAKGSFTQIDFNGFV